MRIRTLPALLAVALLATGCDVLLPGFFRPASDVSPDRTPPRFADPRPAPDIVVVAASEFSIQISDPSGEGTASSGIAPGGISANLLGAAPLPITVALPEVTIDVSAVPDGTIQIGVNAEDRAGNSALYIFSHVLDNTPPQLAFPAPGPPADLQVADPTLPVTIRASATDPHFGSGSITARTPGADGTCGTADDGAIPSEILPNPDRTFSESGTAIVQYVLSNPVPPGGTPRTDTYCWVVSAVDTARAPDGSESGNRATIAARTNVTWMPPS